MRDPSKLKRAIWIGVVLAALGGCGPLKTLYVSQRFECEDMRSSRRDCRLPVASDYEQGIASRYAAMAWFARTAYRYDVPREHRDQRGCDYLTDPTAVHTDLPWTSDGRWIAVDPGEYC